MTFKTSSIGTRRLLLACGLLGGPVIGAISWNAQRGQREFDLAMSCWVVVAFLLLVLALTELVGQTNPNSKRARYGFLEVIIGSDGYASTSKAVAWLWTLIFSSALMLLSAMVWFSELDTKAAFGSSWDSYFLLLGGPFASAVLAKGIVVAKAETQAPITTDAASSGVKGVTVDQSQDGPSVTDLATNSTGDTSLPDSQYVVFSLVAMAYFVGALVVALNRYAGERSDTIELPAIPQAILGLTSLAALTYVGAKAVATTGLRVASISPQSAKAGDSITITLVNAATTLTFDMVTVHFRDSAGTVVASPGPTENPQQAGGLLSTSVVVPALGAGSYTLVVSTPDGSTAPTPFTVTE